jgi:predicted ribosome quality control (RQC) complex YloA/Tae2 family protein
MDFKANASEYFEKAKKAKGRMSMVADQIQRLSQQRSAMLGFIERVNLATRLEGLLALKEEASRLRWLNVQAIPTARKEDRPYEGHRVRELHGPSGYVILYGENAEANDYLTLRVARSNDYWLHVRGDTSAHVVIQTRNQPEKVQMDVLMFAAKVAVQNSRVKHSSYVSVDYTLRKYVRRQRGAAKGSVVYTHEKTLNIES